LRSMDTSPQQAAVSGLSGVIHRSIEMAQFPSLDEPRLVAHRRP
jgi:hypothetical protein